MSQQNLDLVFSSLREWRETGQLPMHRLHEDVEAHDHDIMDAGDYRGRDGVRRWLEDWESAWATTAMEMQELIDAGDDLVLVFIHMSATGRESGVEVSRDDAILYKLREGLILRMDYFNDRARARAAAGLAE